MSLSIVLHRRVAAGVLAGMLVMSGGLLAASPASAAEDTLQIITPVPDQAFDSRTVEVAGTGTPGGVVQVTTGSDNPGPGGGLPIEVGLDGTWETTLTFPEESFVGQLVTVAQTYEGEAAGRQERWIRIPAPVVVFVDSPADGAVVDTRNPVVTGRAWSDTTITASVDGQQVGSTLSEPGGAFTLPLYLGLGEAGTVEVLLESVYLGAQAVQPVILSLTVPASLPAPVITVPVSTVDAGEVVFSGTGTPGYFVVFSVVSSTADAGQGDDAEFGTLVGDDGTWRTTLDLPAGEYRGSAFLTRSIGGEALPTSGAESPVVEFAFAVRAPAAAVPAAPPAATPVPRPRPAAVKNEPVLAATGSTSDLAGGLAGLLLLTGTTALIGARRRTARAR